MPVARPESSDSRIIAHVDMDCFYVQVEQRKQPNLRGQPTAVVQYNSWKGGGLIAVSYEARAYGVKRSMRGDEAKEVCPHIQLVQVPVARGKADLSTYRDAGSEVVSILARKGRCERASIDEVYLDLTDAAETMLKESPPESLQNIDEEVLKSHVLGLGQTGTDDNETVKKWFQRSDADHRDKLLACGAIIVAELRLQVLQETEFSCSAGIAHNKMLAKLASGMNKPAQQTVVPFASVMGLLEPLPIKKMKQLGGKLGSSLQIDLGVNTVGDLLRFPEDKLQDQYGINTGSWLWNIARGISGEEVQGRLLPKSHGSGKTFPGPRALKTLASVEHWLNELSEELSERLQSDLDKNKRIAHTLTLHASAYKFTDSDSYKKFPSKSCPLRYGTAKIQEDAFNLFQAGLREYVGPYITPQGNQSNGWAITGLSVSASKIVAIPSGTCSITKYFQGQEQILSSVKQSGEKFISEADPFRQSCGCESHSGLHPTELLMEWGMERTSINNDVPNCHQQEDITCTHIDKDPHYSLTKQVKGDFAGDTALLSSSDSISFSLTGAESCMVLKQTESQIDSRKEETRIKCEMDGMRRHEQTRRKTMKEKGNSSILRFFQSHDVCSSTKEEHANTIQRMKSPSLDSQSKTGSCSNIEGALPQGSLLVQGETYCSMQNLSQNIGKRDAWRYNIDEIDQAVVNELPPEIQEELRSWLRPQKRANTVKRGSSIAHYFIPSNNAEKS